jgi:hypothetical protein
VGNSPRYKQLQVSFRTCSVHRSSKFFVINLIYYIYIRIHIINLRKFASRPEFRIRQHHQDKHGFYKKLGKDDMRFFYRRSSIVYANRNPKNALHVESAMIRFATNNAHFPSCLNHHFIDGSGYRKNILKEAHGSYICKAFVSRQFI